MKRDWTIISVALLFILLASILVPVFNDEGGTEIPVIPGYTGDTVIQGYNHLPVIYVAAYNSGTEARNAAQYVCDGTADQTEINNALTALGSNGGMVVLSPGEYNTSGTITYNAQTIGKLIISGYGANIDHDGAGYAISCASNLTPVNYWATASEKFATIQGLTIAGTASASGGIQGVSHHFLKVRDCTIINYYDGYGIAGWIPGTLSCEHWTIEDCHISNCKHAIDFNYGSTEKSFNGLTIKNVISSNSVATGTTVGISFRGKFQGATIINHSHSLLNDGENEVGWLFSSDIAAGEARGMTFIDCHLDESSMHSTGTVYGFQFNCESGDPIFLMGCQFSGTGITSDYYFQAAQDLTIIDEAGNVIIKSAAGAYLASGPTTGNRAGLGAYDTDTGTITELLRVLTGAEPNLSLQANLDVNNKTLTSTERVWIISDGAAADIVSTGTGTSGMLLKNIKWHNTGSVSGATKVIEIDLGGTPYYLYVYPTKS